MEAVTEVVNTVFEKRLTNLVSLLHKITRSMNQHRIPHEVIGDLAVTIHVDEVNPDAAPLTRDVDVMIHRSDLERTKHAASKDGFRFRHTAGVDMLIDGQVESARNAVHLLFSGEMVTPGQATLNPPIQPTQKSVEGKQVGVIPVGDLVRMKLSSYRLKDQVHIQVLDQAGLITPEIEKALPPGIMSRLAKVRELE